MATIFYRLSKCRHLCTKREETHLKWCDTQQTPLLLPPCGPVKISVPASNKVDTQSALARLSSTIDDREEEDGRQGTHAEPNTFPSFSPLYCSSLKVSKSLSLWAGKRKTRMISNFTADRPFFPWFGIICTKKVNLSTLRLSPVGCNIFGLSHFLEYWECATAGQSQSGQPGGVKESKSRKSGEWN